MGLGIVSFILRHNGPVSLNVHLNRLLHLRQLGRSVHDHPGPRDNGAVLVVGRALVPAVVGRVGGVQDQDHGATLVVVLNLDVGVSVQGVSILFKISISRKESLLPLISLSERTLSHVSFGTGSPAALTLSAMVSPSMIFMESNFSVNRGSSLRALGTTVKLH